MANNTGTFFNINDNDGIPLVGVSTDGRVLINHLYGNLGVGATNPTSKLFVAQASSDQSSNESATHAIALSSGNNGRTMWMGYDDTIDAGYINAAKTGQSRPIYLQTRNLVNTAVTFVGIATTAPTGTQNQYLQVGGGAYVSGNLGVGVTNPTEALVVNGSRILHKLSGINTVEFGYGAGSGNLDIYGLYVPSGKSFAVYSKGTFAYEVEGSNILINSSSATGTASQPLQVSGGAYVSGNLGIGNTNPGAKLDVLGDIRLSASDAEIEFNTGGARLKGRSNALSIHTGGGLDTETSEQVRINTTGVGIGTTNPGYRLDVQDAINIRKDGSNFSNLYFNGTGTRIRYNDATGNLSFFTNSTERAYVGYLGAFYIISGGLNVSGGDISVSGADRSIINTDNNALILGTNNTERVRINSSGSVGIGTTNPTSKLHVIGDTRVGIDTSQGVILTSPNGTKFRLFVSNAGVLSTVLVP